MSTQVGPHGQDDQRLHMVNGQLRTSDVANAEILAAFLDVPRERFVSASFARLAYLDQDQPSSGPPGRKLLAPRTLALLLQAAAPAPGERVLDVACGSGYSSALLAYLGAVVVALETDATAARAALSGVAGVEVIEGDLAVGAPTQGPFDVIVINGAFEVAPTLLFGQLAPTGRLVGIDARRGGGRGVIVDKGLGGFSARELFDAKADVLDAFRLAPSFAF